MSLADAPLPPTAGPADGVEPAPAVARPAAAPPPLDQPDRDLRRGWIIAGAFFGVLGLWAALAPLDAAVYAPGSVVVANNRQVVQHRDGGTIAAILVREGETVAKDQLLVEMSAGEVRAEESALAAQLIELTAYRSRLFAEQTGSGQLAEPAEWATLSPERRAEARRVLQRQTAEMSSRRTALNSQRGVLNQRGAQLEERIAGAEAQISSVQRQRTLLEEELNGMRGLAARGLVSQTRVRSLERALAELDGREAELRGSIAQAQQAIGETRLQRMSVGEQQDVQIAEELRRVEAGLAELRPRYENAANRLERAQVRAPTAGVVVGLSVHTVGGVIAPGGEMMQIVPARDALVVEAQVNPADADDVQPGMRTEVRFSGMNMRKTPTVFGEVERISADRLTDERTGTPYFVLRVRVPPEEFDRILAAQAEGSRGLVPGVPAEVVVPLRKRTALQYIFEPLNQTLWRSFREH